MDVPWWIAAVTFVVGAVSGMAFTGSRWMKTYNALVRKYNRLQNGELSGLPNPYRPDAFKGDK